MPVNFLCDLKFCLHPVLIDVVNLEAMVPVGRLGQVRWSEAKLE